MTLALLPAVVCVVIMMVNGNVGTGVAVAGGVQPWCACPSHWCRARPRRSPRSVLAMGAGLIAGMGYLGLCRALHRGAVRGLPALQPPWASAPERNGRLLPDAPTRRSPSPSRRTSTTPARSTTSSRTYTAAHFDLVSGQDHQHGQHVSAHVPHHAPRSGKGKGNDRSARCRNGNLEISICRQETAVPEL